MQLQIVWVQRPFVALLQGVRLACGSWAPGGAKQEGALIWPMAGAGRGGRAGVRRDGIFHAEVVVFLACTRA